MYQKQTKSDEYQQMLFRLKQDVENANENMKNKKDKIKLKKKPNVVDIFNALQKIPE